MSHGYHIVPGRATKLEEIPGDGLHIWITKAGEGGNGTSPALGHGVHIKNGNDR
jgi:hypothetical protein